jgi:uncharacterized protein
MQYPAANLCSLAVMSDDTPVIDAILGRMRRVAVLGIKTEARRDQPAFYVPEYLAGAGVEIVPVPVYYPDAKTILGKPVYRRLVDVPGDLDVVDVFRRPQDIEQHVDDMLAKHPHGIRNDEAAARLQAAGIQVVQDRCLLVEHRRWAQTRRA